MLSKIMKWYTKSLIISSVLSLVISVIGHECINNWYSFGYIFCLWLLTVGMELWGYNLFGQDQLPLTLYMYNSLAFFIVFFIVSAIIFYLIDKLRIKNKN